MAEPGESHGLGLASGESAARSRPVVFSVGGDIGAAVEGSVGGRGVAGEGAAAVVPVVPAVAGAEVLHESPVLAAVAAG